MPSLREPLPTWHVNATHLACLVAANLRAEQATCVHGPVGIGKSSIARALIEQTDIAHVETLYLLHRDPTDFGLPVPDLAAGTVRMLTPAWLASLIARAAADPDHLYVVNWDELNRAALSLQNIAARAILENVLGDAILPPNVRHVACVNDAADSAGIIPMPEHLRNRFDHAYLKPEFEPWRVWALPRLKPEVVSYLHSHPDHLHIVTLPQDARERYRHADAFPTPRAWEFVSRVLDPSQPEPVERARIAGAVGVPIATQFWGHLTTFRTIGQRYNIPAIFANPTAAPIPTRNEISDNYALSSAIARLVTPQTANAAGVYLARLPAEFAACGILAMRQRDPSLMNCQSLTAWQLAHQDLF